MTEHPAPQKHTPEQMVAIARAALEDVKAKAIEILPTEGLTSLFHSVIVCSGDSNRQVKALGRHVYERFKQEDIHVLGVEGEQTGEWVLVDAGDVVVHIMQPAVRAHYDLESLWRGARPEKSQHATHAVKRKKS